MTLCTRFAPSPTGLLHLGHAHAALHAWTAARAAGGRFLLRIEDIDTQRCRPAFTVAILRDLAWLGLDWDGEVRVQSEHLAEYQAVLDRLIDRGLAYPCTCTRADIAQAAGAPQGGEGPLYPGTCRNPTTAERAARLALPHAWRLDVARAMAGVPGPLCFNEAGRGRLRCDPARFGDVVLARKGLGASYHLCVTHDDALQGVTLVTRAEDLLPATDLHRLLQALMGWPVPDYAHHGLLADATGRRLAKRDGALSLAALREAGHSPAEVRAMAGWPETPT
ncbi:tRNA glutamyl-Q(34) synthetase GluQRS [Humitalea sp. 24SJ18S-53]|uniref:tRNA glutamyl-Q(34) synthetase GluQRS n=1 Tax=Humitalea sp. 24SJ18S-53 TaxID=3422307 RepID=UPI003D67FA23